MFQIKKEQQNNLNLSSLNTIIKSFFLGAYTPGMMTDVVREVKESARVREDALLSR